MSLLIRGFPDEGKCLHDLVARSYGMHRVGDPLYYTTGGITNAVLKSENPEYWCKRLGPGWGDYLMSMVEMQRDGMSEGKRIEAGERPKMVFDLPREAYERANAENAKRWLRGNAERQNHIKRQRHTKMKDRRPKEFDATVDYAGPTFVRVVWEEPSREDFDSEDDYNEKMWIWLTQFWAEIEHSMGRYKADQLGSGGQ